MRHEVGLEALQLARDVTEATYRLTRTAVPDLKLPASRRGDLDGLSAMILDLDELAQHVEQHIREAALANARRHLRVVSP